jgi:hypothetical protein
MLPDFNTGDASGPQIVMVQIAPPVLPFNVAGVDFAEQLVIEGGGVMVAGGMGLSAPFSQPCRRFSFGNLQTIVQRAGSPEVGNVEVAQSMRLVIRAAAGAAIPTMIIGAKSDIFKIRIAASFLTIFPPRVGDSCNLLRPAAGVCLNWRACSSWPLLRKTRIAIEKTRPGP